MDISVVLHAGKHSDYTPAAVRVVGRISHKLPRSIVNSKQIFDSASGF